MKHIEELKLLTGIIAGLLVGLIAGAFGVLLLDACVSCKNATELQIMRQDLGTIAQENWNNANRIEELERKNDAP